MAAPVAPKPDVKPNPEDAAWSGERPSSVEEDNKNNKEEEE